jgi:hypothetical protein
MTEFVTLKPDPLSSTILVQEQYGFALNRASYSEEPERILLSLIEKKDLVARHKVYQGAFTRRDGKKPIRKKPMRMTKFIHQTHILIKLLMPI